MEFGPTLKYRAKNEDVGYLVGKSVLWWRLPKTRRRADNLLNEIYTSRRRIRNCATVVSELNFKIGGAGYRMTASEVLSMMGQGVYQRIKQPILTPTDEDFRGP